MGKGVDTFFSTSSASKSSTEVVLEVISTGFCFKDLVLGFFFTGLGGVNGMGVEGVGTFSSTSSASKSSSTEVVLEVISTGFCFKDLVLGFFFTGLGGVNGMSVKGVGAFSSTSSASKSSTEVVLEVISTGFCFKDLVLGFFFTGLGGVNGMG